MKPNQEKAPNVFTATMVMEQLLYSGVLAAVKIWQQGYASRIPFRCVVELLGRKKVPARQDWPTAHFIVGASGIPPAGSTSGSPEVSPKDPLGDPVRNPLWKDLGSSRGCPGESPGVPLGNGGNGVIN